MDSLNKEKWRQQSTAAPTSFSSFLCIPALPNELDEEMKKWKGNAAQRAKQSNSISFNQTKKLN